MKIDITPVIFFPETHKPSLILRKNIGHTPKEEHSIKHLTNNSKNCLGHQK